MKKVLVYILLSLGSYASLGFKPATENGPNEIKGFYWSPKKDAKIEIYSKGSKYFGRFVWLSTPREDIKNPVEALQARDIVGLEFLTSFSYDGTIYTGGEIYDPETGKTYSSKMTLEGNRLKVRGYIGISLFGRTEYFQRIK